MQPVRLTGSGFPAGTILASNITVTLTPASSGTGPTVQTTATGFTRAAGTIGTVTFLVPTSLTLTAPTAYLVSLSDTTGTTSFASSNTSALTIDPPASVAVSPAQDSRDSR